MSVKWPDAERLENAKANSADAARKLRDLRTAGGREVDWDAAIDRLYTMLGLSPEQRSVGSIRKTPGQRH